MIVTLYTTLCNILETIILSNWDPSYLNIKENSSQHECPPPQPFQMKKKKKGFSTLVAKFGSTKPRCLKIPKVWSQMKATHNLNSKSINIYVRW